MQLDQNETSKLLITVGQIDERTKNMEKTLNGNGQPGLKQKVDELESRADTAKGMGLAALGLGGSALGMKLLEWAAKLFHWGNQ